MAGLLIAGAASGAVSNGGFESGDFTDWDVVGVGSVVDASYGATPTEGMHQGLITTGGTASDNTLETFFGLPVGTLDSMGGGNATFGSGIKQEVQVFTGQELTFDFQFLCNDYPPYFDFAFFVVDGTAVLLDSVVNCDGNPSPTPFQDESPAGSYTHTFASSGTVTIGFGVIDLLDSVVDSGVLIDNIELSSPCDDPSAATILGTAGDDHLLGTPGDDIIFGLGGNDIILGKGGNDILCGGDGNDSISGGDGNDVIEGGSGYNWLFGNNGDDTIRGGDDGNEMQGNAGFDDLKGGAGYDTIYGGTDDDVLSGGGGTDDMFGNEGNDTLFGDEGEDWMLGGDGNDCLNGGADDDQLLGGEGDDCLSGDDGKDRVDCGGGNDSYSDGEWDFSGCETAGVCANSNCP